METTHKILFVCHGNICRSPMAEYVMKALVKEAGMAERFVIASAATSTEELGNPVHGGTQAKLRQEGIPCPQRRAVRLHARRPWRACREAEGSTAALLIVEDVSLPSRRQGGLGHGEAAIHEG